MYIGGGIDMSDFEQLKLFPDAKDVNNDREEIKDSLKTLRRGSKLDCLDKSIKNGLDNNFANFLKNPLPIIDKKELEINNMNESDLQKTYNDQVSSLMIIDFENAHKLLQIDPTKKFTYSLSVLNKLSEILGRNRISYFLTFKPEDIIDIVSYLNGDFPNILDKNELDLIKENLKNSIPIKNPEIIKKIRSNLELVEKLITFDEFCTVIKNKRKFTVLSNFSKTYESSNGFIVSEFYAANVNNLYPPKGFPNKVLDNGKRLNIKKGSSSYIFVNPRNFNKNVLEEYIRSHRGAYIVLMDSEKKSYTETFESLDAAEILYMSDMLHDPLRNYTDKLDSILETIQTGSKGQ